MTSKLVWASGIAGFFAVGLAAGAVIPSPILAFVLLALLLLGGPALGLVPGMRPRLFAPLTRMGRAKLYAAFLVAVSAGAILGVMFQWGVTAWLSFGLIGLVLLAFAFKVGSTPRPHQE
jgi:hypothetical protein